MALVKCRDCGKDISKRAEACPHCGHKPCRRRLFTRFFTVCFGLPVAITVFACYLVTNAAAPNSETSGSFTYQPTLPEPEITEAAPPKPETYAQRVARTKRERAAQRAMSGAIALKKMMRDPESFKLESALVMESTGGVCYEYRSKNGFGGVNAGQAVLSADLKNFKTSEDHGFATLWDKECANRRGTETAAGLGWLLKAW